MTNEPDPASKKTDTPNDQSDNKEWKEFKQFDGQPKGRKSFEESGIGRRPNRGDDGGGSYRGSKTYHNKGEKFDRKRGRFEKDDRKRGDRDERPRREFRDRDRDGDFKRRDDRREGGYRKRDDRGGDFKRRDDRDRGGYDRDRSGKRDFGDRGGYKKFDKPRGDRPYYDRKRDGDRKFDDRKRDGDFKDRKRVGGYDRDRKFDDRKREGGFRKDKRDGGFRGDRKGGRSFDRSNDRGGGRGGFKRGGDRPFNRGGGRSFDRGGRGKFGGDRRSGYKSARELALIILEDFEEKQQPVDRMIERWLDWWRAPDNRDHALVYEMCMGVVRHRRLLDHAIAPLCTKPLNELTVDLLYALRLGIYQLFFMDRVPDHAAVKETVSALPEGPGRMANAVLREAQRQGEAILKIGDTIATPGGRSETREDVPSTEPEHVKLEKAEADTIADDSPAEAISVDEADTVEISVDEVIEAADDAAAETVDESVETATDDSSESEQSDEETAETLQQVSEDSDAPEPAPVEVSEPLTSLQKAAIEWSFPDWLAEYWAEYLGEEDTIALMKTSHDRPFLILRANAPAISREEVIQRLKTHDEFPLASPVEHSPFGIRLGTVGSNGNASDWKFLKEGTAVVQDEASQLAALLMQPKPGELLLDFCAAPGGKTTLMASQMKNKGLVVAVDRTMPKLRRITQMAQRLGQTNVWTEETPPAEKAWPSSGKLSGPPFDGILVDAPCSGLGTLARRPDVKWLKGKNDMERLAEIQLGILKRVWARLRPGGRLVYSTCTLSPLENEQVVQAFLENQADARLDPLDSERFEFLNNSMITSDGYFRSMPHQHAMDGMFAARLIKVANTLAG